MNTSLQVHGEHTGVSLYRTPEEVLSEAHQAAAALMKVVALKKKPVMFNNEQYLEREDWGTVAKFYGCTAKIVETRPVEFGQAVGWEAIAVCLDRNGNELSRAESMCLSDEANWGAVPKYEWKDVLDESGKKIWDQKLRNGKGGYKAEKVQVGTEPKPQFQLRSMAQTRAEAKVLKSVFGYVVVLAGFKPSVAEEMTGNEQHQDPQPEQKPEPQIQRKSQQQKQEGNDVPIQTNPGCISEKQIKLLFVIQKQAQINDEAMKAIVKDVCGCDHRNEVKSGDFSKLLLAIDPEEKYHQQKQG